MFIALVFIMYMFTKTYHCCQEHYKLTTVSMKEPGVKINKYILPFKYSAKCSKLTLFHSEFEQRLHTSNSHLWNMSSTTLGRNTGSSIRHFPMKSCKCLIIFYLMLIIELLLMYCTCAAIHFTQLVHKSYLEIIIIQIIYCFVYSLTPYMTFFILQF
jgi:hypothetical protein